jgi:hypothetical protein
MHGVRNREENKLNVIGNKVLNREFGIKVREMINIAHEDTCILRRVSVKCGPLTDRQTRKFL